LNFLRLSRLTGQQELEEKAHQMFALFGSKIDSMPQGYAFFLTAMLFSKSKSNEVVLVGSNEKDTQNMLSILSEDFRPFTTSILYSEEHKDLKELIPFIDNYTTIENKPTAYVCENFVCHEPITDGALLREKLNR